MRRNPPSSVARQLRQEARFGCAICGHPIVEFHHIIPWREKEHFEVAHMVAVCPTHHSELGKLPRSKAYEAKENPYNLKNGILRGMLGSETKTTSFELGSNTFVETPIVFEYYGQVILGYKIVEGEVLLDVFIPDEDFWPVVKISENNLTADLSEFWDIEFKTNWISFKRKKGENFLTIDLRKPVARISGSLSIGGRDFVFSPSTTNFDGLIIKNSTISNCRAGIGFGDGKHKVLVPNFAMQSPSVKFVPL